MDDNKFKRSVLILLGAAVALLLMILVTVWNMKENSDFIVGAVNFISDNLERTYGW